MKLVLLSALAMTIALVHSAIVPTVTGPGLSDDDLLSEVDCPPNSSFSECGNHSNCDRTCENKDELYPPIPCPPICVRRCVCDLGYVRNGNGECVDRIECPAGSDY